ncbi:unnamed protein product [Acanthoscelides obtectus]|uniref:Uncharacterized protein n=1 Tax=Acanthoscelides obtectus TaxID=200917 RepID=A0A9P0MEY1_ACAOB|nr:unnamed protein product [Acanthoscelides obtectus]CAK1644131.1 hypothetical protein AOBTE_LOCUS13849 [Acanthoscelides obtectus]
MSGSFLEILLVDLQKTPDVEAVTTFAGFVHGNEKKNVLSCYNFSSYPRQNTILAVCPGRPDESPDAVSDLSNLRRRGALARRVFSMAWAGLARRRGVVIHLTYLLMSRHDPHTFESHSKKRKYKLGNTLVVGYTFKQSQVKLKYQQQFRLVETEVVGKYRCTYVRCLQ